MNDDLNLLEYDEESEAPAASGRRGLSRLVPRFLRRDKPTSSSESVGTSSPGRLRRLLGVVPRLLRRRRAGSEEVSAAELALQRDERPLEELDDRLQALRQRASSRPQANVSTGQALYDVDEVLVTPEIIHKPGGVISPIALSKAQQEQVALLRDMVGTSAQNAEPETSKSRFGRSARVFSLSAVPQLLGSLLILLMISLPFVSSDFREGDLPPPEFDEDRHGATTAYNLLDNLSLDDYVLVAFEYGPTAAGELDPLADVILRHILAQGSKPVIVSSNPIAMVHARNVIAEIQRSVAVASIELEENRDYFLLRYLSGGALGLRDLSRNFDSVARFSSKGIATELEFSSLNDMTLIVLIAERAEDIRNWAEQVATETETYFIAVSGYAAQPLAQPYVDESSEIVGMIVGIRDVYTYGEKLEAIYGVFQSPTPAPDTPTPTETATETPMPSPTLMGTATPLASDTPVPIVILTATEEPEPDLEQFAVVPQVTATATQALVSVIEVTAGGLVNIRRSPNTASDILGVAAAGDIFEVIGTNGDGSWINFLMPDGVEAWIADFLVEQYQMTAAEFAAAQLDDTASIDGTRSVLRLKFTLHLGKNRPRFYQANQQVIGDRPAFVQLRDRRQEVAKLDAMTMGTIAAVLIILVGNAFYAMRGLMTRRRQAKVE